MTVAIAQFWGKASSIGPRAMHPNVHHSLDVAAVVSEYICCEPGRLQRIALATGVREKELVENLPFLTSLHDIGKYTRAFQAKSPEFWPAALGPYRDLPSGKSHVTTGFSMLVEIASSEDRCGLFEQV